MKRTVKAGSGGKRKPEASPSSVGSLGQYVAASGAPAVPKEALLCGLLALLSLFVEAVGLVARKGVVIHAGYDDFARQAELGSAGGVGV